jgi:hypothetical protein
MTPDQPPPKPATNNPDELNELWGKICNMLCAECGKSECLVATHQAYYCRCGHKRQKHNAKHPHGCSTNNNCDCTEAYFAPFEEVKALIREQLRVCIVTMDGLKACD